MGLVNPQAAAVSKKRNEPFLLETGKAAAGRRVGAVPAVGAAHGIASKCGHNYIGHYYIIMAELGPYPL